MNLEKILLRFDIEFQSIEKILVTRKKWEMDSEKEMNRIICGLESSELELSWETWSICGDCHRHR